MSELKQIQDILGRTAARQRMQRGWQGLWRGALVGALAYLGALLLFKVAPVPKEMLRWSAIASVACAIVGFLIGWLRRVTPEAAARFLDQKQHLQERLSTALEFSKAGRTDRWNDLVLADATSAAAAIDPAKLMPWKLPRLARWVGLAAVAAVGVGFIPEYRSKAYVEKKKDAEVIKEIGQQLANLTRRSLADRKPALEPTEKSLEKVAELGDRLQQAKLTRENALKDLASATDKLKQDLGALGKDPAIRRLERAARTPGNTPTQSAQSLQKQMDAISKQLGDKAAQNPDAVDQLQKDMQALKDAAKGMANQDGSQGAASRQQMAKMASELARKAESLGMPLPSLDEAIAALNSAQAEQFLKDLNIADQDLQKMADMAKTLAQLQQQSERLGKDLAEQLKNGQAQAAIESLQKMRDMLAKAQLSPEQMQKLVLELKEAVKPGEQYGDVGKLLEKATAECKSGNKSGAGKEMAAAQKELEKLLGDMSDMEGLMAAMQNLQKAQMCVGNGMGWGQCPGGVGGKSGKPTSKSRRGYGNWSNEDPWAMPDSISDGWDNSGLPERADQNSKGLTDRDSSLPDNLSPTKVKGQLQPGGPMPSITLRGVSIKGDSKIAYTEAVASAQTDAQTALSQEKVPRAYQNTVRDYFDDLKK
ncbi:MAG: hypothetical protein EXS36_08690 [Pedosphaera sp.]|nr:hypothetical protein [Pedosphaera sp.]